MISENENANGQVRLPNWTVPTAVSAIVNSPYCDRWLLKLVCLCNTCTCTEYARKNNYKNYRHKNPTHCLRFWQCPIMFILQVLPRCQPLKELVLMDRLTLQPRIPSKPPIWTWSLRSFIYLRRLRKVLQHKNCSNTVHNLTTCSREQLVCPNDSTSLFMVLVTVDGGYSEECFMGKRHEQHRTITIND